MTVYGFDVDSSNKAGFNFQTAYAQGMRVAWIKFGGMNLQGNAPYRMSGYQAFVDAAFAAGFEAVGDYMLTGGSNPANAAAFWNQNHDPRIKFHALDNETLDYGNTWNDGQACAYFDAITPGMDRWMYGSRDSLWNSQQWPGLASRSIKAHVAIYNGSPMQNINPGTYPASLVLAHQYTSSASIGGLDAVDADAWADNAFTTTSVGRTDMEIISRKATGKVYSVNPGILTAIGSTPGDLSGALAAAYNSLAQSNIRFLDDAGFAGAMNAYGLGEFTFDQINALKARQHLVASWVGSTATITDAQAASIAQQVAASIPKPPTKGTATITLEV